MPKRKYSSSFINDAYQDYRGKLAQPYKRRRKNFMEGSTNLKKRDNYSTVPRSRGVYANGEMKYFDTERSTTAIPASTGWTGTEFPPNVGTPTTLVCPTVGSEINQRQGRNILLHRIQVKGVIQAPTQPTEAAGDNAALVRIALVQDQQTNATQAQGEQIFEPPTTVSALMAVNSFQNLDSLGRFVVHKDKKMFIGNPSLTFDGTNVIQQGLVKEFKMGVSFNPPLPIQFNATNGGTIADVVDKSFCIYAMATSANLVPSITYQARAYYKEQS